MVRLSRLAYTKEIMGWFKMYDATLRVNRKGKPKEWLSGNLLVAKTGAIAKEPFMYGQTQNRSYTELTGSMPIEYVGVTEQIYTTRTDLPFGIGSKVELHDGRIMSIEKVDKDLNERIALIGGDAVVGYYITLNGGGK